MIHRNVTVTNQQGGGYEIEYTEGRPMAGDQVLMSVEFFEDACRAMNLGLTSQVLGPDDRLVLTSKRRLSSTEFYRIDQQLQARGLAERAMLIGDGLTAEVLEEKKP